MEKRKSVGIVITVEMNGVRYALLQVRGQVDSEKIPGKLNQSWPGIYQVSAHGTLNPGEDIFSGLYREVDEELGPYVAGAVMALNLLPDLKLPPSLVEILRSERPEEIVQTYGIDLPWQLVAKIPRGSSGLRLVDAEAAALIRNAEDLHEGKRIGPSGSDRNLIWMFPDERKAVIKALQA